MRSPTLNAELYRVDGPAGTNNGMFVINNLRVIVSDGDGWDHVSVSLATRCPTWDEMEIIRELFFQDDETVMQLSVPRTEHINYHPFCLHMWRPQSGEIPHPPAWMVGPSS